MSLIFRYQPKIDDLMQYLEPSFGKKRCYILPKLNFQNATRPAVRKAIRNDRGFGVVFLCGVFSSVTDLVESIASKCFGICSNNVK
jgi:hypothetical protein